MAALQLTARIWHAAFSTHSISSYGEVALTGTWSASNSAVALKTIGISAASQTANSKLFQFATQQRQMSGENAKRQL